MTFMDVAVLHRCLIPDNESRKVGGSWNRTCGGLMDGDGDLEEANIMNRNHPSSSNI
jgi:hypothetical protein